MKLTDSTELLSREYYPHIEAHQPKLLETLERTGTPIFLCERENFVDRFRTLTECLSARWGDHIVGYSFKTNYLVAKSGIVRQCGAWAEVVSGHEYRLARELDFPGTQIIFNGPHKTDDDLYNAFGDGALVNINDHDELERIVKITSAAPSPIEVGIRLSSTLPRLGHSRFGFSLENGEAAEAAKRIEQCPTLNLVALHTHLYGDTDDANIYSLAATRLGQFAQQQIPNCQSRLKYIDLGGGFPAHSPKPKSRESWHPQPIDTYIGAISDALHPCFPPSGPRPPLVVEPGRYLTCDGIILVQRVLHVKQRDGRQVVNCDGSISMVPLTHYCPQIIRAFTPELHERSGNEASTIIHGSTCRENDILYEGVFPATEPGDFLVHFAVGAYNSSLGPDFIYASPSLELF